MRILAALAALLAMSAPAHAADAVRSAFGKLADGRAVEAVTLTNKAGVSATVIAWGATLQSVILPDKAGQPADVALGYSDMAGYLAKPEYFGTTVGRFANRIANGRFTLDGKVYQVPVNDNGQSLHGGTAGFDKQLWRITRVRSGRTASVTLRLVSPDGDQGYPGRLTTTATYSLDEANALTIEYRATTTAPTVVNITNHAYWNLRGEGSGSAMEHQVTIAGDRFLPVDVGLIPTGELRPVEGTAFDFRTPRAVGERVRDARDQQLVFGKGYDHNWITADRPGAAPRLQARVSEPVSGRSFELLSNQPGLQFYSGNFLDGTVIGKSGRAYRQGDTVVFEPQLFPDTPNQPSFPSARLNPGQSYRNIIVYRFNPGEAR